MFDKKEELENFENAETVVGASVKLKGNLKSEGNITVNGSVSGEINTKGAVKVGAGADVRANIKSRNAVISGVVQGNIVADDQLSITETGKVYGDIQANVLSISPGAFFTGKSIMPEEKAKEVEPIAEIDEDEIGEEIMGKEEVLVELED